MPKSDKGSYAFFNNFLATGTISGDKLLPKCSINFFVGFHDSREVLSALKAFHEVIVGGPTSPDLPNRKLLDLFKAMCDHLKIDPAPLADNFFLQPFNVRQ